MQITIVRILVIFFLIFEFSISEGNKIKPRHLDKINMPNMINNGQYDDVESVIRDFSTENFETNGINLFLIALFIYRLF